MMRHEFIERTGYTPEIRRGEDGWTVEYDEYRYIEQSYYDSECVNKDEFCKEWKKNFKAGFWKRELQLLIKLEREAFRIKSRDEQIEELKKDLNDTANEYLDLRKEYKESKRKLDRITAIVTGECQIAE